MSDPIVLTRRIAADPAVVYSYLTDSVGWARWQGVEAKIEARPQGIFKMVMGNGMKARGQFVELIPDQRVVFTWGWIDHPGVPPGSSTVEVDLVADGSSTVLTLTHSGLPDDEVPIHAAGWQHHLDRLTALGGGTDPGPDTGPA